jgi:von Willebrand factor type A domain
MKRSYMKRIALLILCCLARASWGQQTVSVPVIVGGEAHVSIKASDLKVELNGQPVTILSITPLGSEHLQYVLLNDQNRHTRWPNGNKQQTELADRFLKQVVVAGTDMGTLINFGEYVFLDVQNDNNPQKLAAKVEPVGNVDRSQLYDALVMATRWLAKQPRNSATRRVLVLFSDGQDNASKSNLRQATEAVQLARIPILIVAPSSVENRKEGETLLQLASDCGGKVYFMPRDTKQTNLEFIKHDLDQEFLLTLDVSSFQFERLRLSVSETTNHQISVIAPAQILR